jgi:D-alanyl-D-alanine carboxypeptidase-like protein
VPEPSNLCRYRVQRLALAGLAAVLLAAPLAAGCTASRRPKRTSSTSRSAVSNELPVQEGSPTPSTSPQRALIVGDLRDDSTTVSCADGTYSLGSASGYVDGTPVRIRLCAVGGFHSTAPESTPGSHYYVPGAIGNVIVNARVSGAVLALFRFARIRGVTLEANSSYRSMRYQRVLCAADDDCRRGNYIYVARPGWSNHQLGAAIDFADIYGTGGRSCARARAANPASPTWRFLDRYAHRFGFRQYAPEAWHWDALNGPDRC